MADEFGRVNPVTPHFLNRNAREERYQGRHAKKHLGHGQENTELETDPVTEEEKGASAPRNHIDLRI